MGAKRVPTSNWKQVKKLAFLADTSAKPLTSPPPSCQEDDVEIYMFLKQERNDMDDFERRKKIGCKSKILTVMLQVA